MTFGQQLPDLFLVFAVGPKNDPPSTVDLRLEKARQEQVGVE